MIFVTYIFLDMTRTPIHNEYDRKKYILAFSIVSIFWPILYIGRIVIKLYLSLKEILKTKTHSELFEEAFLVEMHGREIIYKKKPNKNFKFGRKYCK